MFCIQKTILRQTKKNEGHRDKSWGFCLTARFSLVLIEENDRNDSDVATYYNLQKDLWIQGEEAV